MHGPNTKCQVPSAELLPALQLRHFHEMADAVDDHCGRDPFDEGCVLAQLSVRTSVDGTGRARSRPPDVVHPSAARDGAVRRLRTPRNPEPATGAGAWPRAGAAYEADAG